MTRLPSLGTAEDQQSEFKSSEAVRTEAGRRRLLREVVGMLNAGGGSIWVGVRESEGVAVAYDPLSRGELPGLVAALKDALLDSVQPRPDLARGVLLREHPCGEGVVLEVAVAAIEATDVPFHLASGAERSFFLRHDDRLRPMTLDEIRQSVHLAEPKPDPLSSVEDLSREAHQAVKDDPHPWLSFAGKIIRDEDSPLSWREEVPSILVHPPPELVRLDGWGFQVSHVSPPRFTGGKRGENWVLASGYEANGYRLLRARRDGSLVFRTRADHLQREVPDEAARVHAGARGMFHPYALIETVVSLVRLMGHLWREMDDVSSLVAIKVELIGVKDWLLPAYSPRATGYHFYDLWRMSQLSIVASSIHSLLMEHFLKNPDPLAYRVIRDLYFEFGFPEEKVIPCFPADRSRFVHPR